VITDTVDDVLPTAVDVFQKHREDSVSEEEDDQPARFVAASQYDPAGVSKCFRVGSVPNTY
jgi:hypothetical protein